jgi:alkanesulfonate monooxygenase SsuD/methylene tetrahydromethanopterin reductase-like flavin-dependent oxidoreductase (luciferase family)
MMVAADLGLGQMFVTAVPLDVMARGVAKFNAVRALKGLPPNQPTTMMYLHCSADREANEQARRYAGEQAWAARNHYAVWNAPSFAGVEGYEDYAKVFAQGRELEEHKAKAAEDGHIIGTPDEIIEKLERTQEMISLEYLIVHPQHGSKPPEQARSSLELFAKEVLPAVHEMDTPLHPHSLGDPEALEHEGSLGGAIG